MSGGVVNYSIEAGVSPSFNHTFSHDAIGLLGGFDLSFNASKGMRISTGLHFFDVFYTFDYVWIALNPNDPSIPIEKRTTIKMVDIPVVVRLSILEGNKAGFYGLVGGSAALRREVQQQVTYGDGSIRETDNTFKIVPSVFSGLGVKYRLAEGTHLSFETRYRWFTKGFDPELNQNPTSIRFILGLSSRIDWKCIFKKNVWKPLPRCE